MDIHNLQAFVAVATTGSFSRAAEQLCLTQPAVSKRITALEQQLGARLFDRIGRQITLTEAGQMLWPRAGHILAEMEDSRRAIANLDRATTGRLGIGTSHHIGLHRLPPVLRTFTANYPDVVLDLHFMDSEAACQAVERGELELGIVTLPPTPSPNLLTTAIWDDPLSIVVNHEHPLAARKRRNATVLAEYSAILPARGTYTRELLERAVTPLDIELRVGLSTNYLETIKMMVSVGLGWSILPQTMVDKAIRAIPITGFQLQRTLGVVSHTGRTQSNAARALVEQLLSRCSLSGGTPVY